MNWIPLAIELPNPPPSAPSTKLPEVFCFSFEDCRDLLMTEMGKHHRDATFQIRERRAAEKLGGRVFRQLVDPFDITPTNLTHRVYLSAFLIRDRRTA
ncbi:hypothetical protein [Mesorhizobium sp. NZP2298]|uniref:hypothetical protein n=1 Tax=Mesorhizobium sp. NZP2298 TaxID=2483403 RepID=UPI001551E072|nr:hypothetical protein [Mesorhizobium sp. NZP2298]